MTRLTRQEEKELFRILAGIHKFREWLDQQESECIPYLKKSKDMATINHQQGRVSIIDDMKSHMDAAIRDK